MERESGVLYFYQKQMGWKGGVGFCIFCGGKWVGKGEWGSVFLTEANGLERGSGVLYFQRKQMGWKGRVGFCIFNGSKWVGKGEWGSVFFAEVNPRGGGGGGGTWVFRGAHTFVIKIKKYP